MVYISTFYLQDKGILLAKIPIYPCMLRLLSQVYVLYRMLKQLHASFTMKSDRLYAVIMLDLVSKRKSMNFFYYY